MNRRIHKKEQIQNIAIGGILILILLAIVFVIFMPTKKVNVETSEEVIEHNLYLLKDDGTFSKYNTNLKKYLSEITITNKGAIKNKDSFINPLNISMYNENFVLTSPKSNEIIIASEEKDSLKVESKISLDESPNQIEISQDLLAVTYLNSPKVDFFDLKSSEKVNSITLEENVDSIEIDDEHLYLGTGKNISILSKNSTKDNFESIYTGARTISLLKASDGFLYAGNIFAADSKNSLLLKIDVANNNINDLLELEKEYPIEIVENNSDLIIVCKGKADSILDGVSVIDKDIFTRKTNISTGDTPNSITIIDNEFAYVVHDNGQVTLIDMRDGYKKFSTFNLNGVKAIIGK